MQNQVPHELDRKLIDHTTTVHRNLRMAFRGNIGQEEINACLQAAVYEAEAFLFSVKAEATLNIRTGEGGQR